MPDVLYDQDFYRWTQEQARALRAHAAEGANAPVDWENVAEEIESLGRSDRREIVSRLATIIEHLLKLEYSPAREPRAGWRETVLRERLKVESLVGESPSLRSELPAMTESAWKLGSKLARASFSLHGEAEAARRIGPSITSYTADQILGEWLPPEPS